MVVYLNSKVADFIDREEVLLARFVIIKGGNTTLRTSLISRYCSSSTLAKRLGRRH